MNNSTNKLIVFDVFRNFYDIVIRPKTNKFHTFGTVPKSNIKIVERGKIIHLTHKYMIAHFHGLVQTLQ